MNPATSSRKGKSKLPKRSPPAFTLPGHEWRPAGDMRNDGEYIYAVKGWALWRKKPLPTQPLPAFADGEGNIIPTAPQQRELVLNYQAAKERLMNPEVPEWAKSLFASPLFEKPATLSGVLNALPRFIESAIDRRKRIASINSAGSPPILAELDRQIDDAAGFLFDITKKGCEDLTRLAKQHPETFKKIAYLQTTWPLMMSSQPGLGEKPSEVLKDLQLGKNADAEVNPGARVNTQKASRCKGIKEIAAALVNCVQSEWYATGSKLNGQPVGRLSTQDDACFDTWWGTAKQRLLEAYPKPEGIPELTSLVTAPSRKIYPSVMRQAIFRKLQSAFRALANKPG